MLYIDMLELLTGTRIKLSRMGPLNASQIFNMDYSSEVISEQKKAFDELTKQSSVDREVSEAGEQGFMSQ